MHQDSWGKQGRRVLSTPPPNILLGPDPTDAILALTRCNTTKEAQKWTLDNTTGHLWTTALSNLPGNKVGNQRWCVGAATIPWGRPAGLVPCDNPAYAYNASANWYTKSCDHPVRISSVLLLRCISDSGICALQRPPTCLQTGNEVVCERRAVHWCARSNELRCTKAWGHGRRGLQPHTAGTCSKSVHTALVSAGSSSVT